MASAIGESLRDLPTGTRLRGMTLTGITQCVPVFLQLHTRKSAITPERRICGIESDGIRVQPCSRRKVMACVRRNDEKMTRGTPIGDHTGESSIGLYLQFRRSLDLFGCDLIACTPYLFDIQSVQ
jgi:hypothetical protein